MFHVNYFWFVVYLTVSSILPYNVHVVYLNCFFHIFYLESIWRCSLWRTNKIFIKGQIFLSILANIYVKINFIYMYVWSDSELLLYLIFVCLFYVKSKITKILNFEENSKPKVPKQMAKSNDKTHQTNGQQLSYSWLSIGIFKCRKWWIESGFFLRSTSHLYDSRIKFRYIYNDEMREQNRHNK